MSYTALACCLALVLGFNLGYLVHGIVSRRPQLK